MIVVVSVLLLFVFGVVSEEERVATNQPQFVSTGGERRVQEGHSAELECEVTDLGEFVLLWKFNRTNVLFAGNLRIYRDDRISRNDETGALLIRDFRAENVGEYSCQVSTNPPQDIVYEVSLLGPPLINNRNKEVTVKKWEAAELLCETNAPKVEWKFEQRVVGSEPKLRIERARPEDSGLYTCVASNELGQTTREFQLKVLFAPELQVVESLVHAPLGETAILQCLVSAEPSANVNWFRDANQKVLPSDHVIIDRNETTATLKLSSVKESDFDEYSCHANNSMGAANDKIVVTGKPSMPKFTSPQLAGRGTSYVIGWRVESQWPISKYVVRWKDRHAPNWMEKTIEEAELPREFQLEVTSLEADQNYDVEIDAHNKWGFTRSEVFAFVTSWAHVTTPSLVFALTLALSVNSFQ